MSVVYIHLDHEAYKSIEQQMKEFKETTHRSEGGFYHKSIRLRVDQNLIYEFHGPLVGGYGHHQADPGPLDLLIECELCHHKLDHDQLRACPHAPCPYREKK